MNYSKAKARALELANERRLPHAILFNGKDYSVELARNVKGKAYEIVNPTAKKNAKAAEKTTEPTETGSDTATLPTGAKKKAAKK